MKKLFLKQKPVALLLLLKDSTQQWYPSKLARSAGCSYVYAVKVLSQMQKQNVVQISKIGKNSVVSLSSYGAQLASSLDELCKKIDAAKKETQAEATQKEKEAQSSQKQEEKEKREEKEKKEN